MYTPRPGSEIEIDHEGVWTHLRVAFVCDKGIATPYVPGRGRTELSRKYPQITRGTTVITWADCWAIRPFARCPECGGSGQEGLDGLGRPHDGPCAICGGSGRYIPAPWADATGGLGLGQATEQYDPHIGFKEPR